MVKVKKTKGRKKVDPKKPKLSKEEKKKKRDARKFKTDINTVFINSGCTQIPTRNNNFILIDREGEIDNIFIYENIMVLVEDTTAKDQDSLKKHILKTQDFVEHINKHKTEFIKILEETFDKFKDIKSQKYRDTDYILLPIYCSLNRVDKKYQNRYNKLLFMDYPALQYFLRLSKTISRSSRFELFKFLGLSLKDIGHQESGDDYRYYEGFLLPESPSGFPDKYKIVSFLIEPQRLMEQGYVLRKDGWRDHDCLYQRLLIPSKITNMRKYLTEQQRVFINNIIVTLPDNTKVCNTNNKEISHTELVKKQNVNIGVKKELNTIGIIDGQHRVFTYHEGLDDADAFISILRDKQHLLLTGIIYPENTKEEEKIKFEAMLFLEINDKQSRVKGDLKQAIETLVNPYSSIAIAKSVIINLGLSGPLTGMLEEHFYDKGKLKTTSIVSYGMKHIVKLDDESSFFGKWNHVNKDSVAKKRNKSLLAEYVAFCSDEINKFMNAFKYQIGSDMWTLDKKSSAALRTTTINGIIFCIRRIIENNELDTFENYKIKLQKLRINFDPEKFTYKSSHWKDLGDEMYNQCFKGP